MNIEELKKLKEEIQIKFDEEKNEYESLSQGKEKEIVKEELKDISNELLKTMKLIEIYQTNQLDELREAKLERLYMQLMSEISEESFNALNEDKLFELFERFFPDEWVYIDDIHKKEELLLEAICSNQVIRIKATTKTLNNFHGDF